MSIVTDALSSVNLNRVPAKLAEYEMLIEGSWTIFKLDGKGLEEACKNHAQDLMCYDVILQECKTIEDAIRLKVEEIEGKLYKTYNESYQRSLGTSDIKQYIKGDPQYVATMEVLLEVMYTKRRLEAVVEALKSMGWSLGHIVKLRIAQLEHVTL